MTNNKEEFHLFFLDSGTIAREIFIFKSDLEEFLKKWSLFIPKNTLNNLDEHEFLLIIGYSPEISIQLNIIED